MEMIIGRSLTPLKSSIEEDGAPAGATTTRAGKCRMSVRTAPLAADDHESSNDLGVALA
jgi:hypothetical protein